MSIPKVSMITSGFNLSILSIPAYLIVFSNEHTMIQSIQEYRNKNNLSQLTYIFPTKITDLLQLSIQALDLNPFQTEHFIWIQNQDITLSSLNTISKSNLFHVHMYNILNDKYLIDSSCFCFTIAHRAILQLLHSNYSPDTGIIYVIQQFYDQFEFSYGKQNQCITNYHSIHTDFEYIFQTIFKKLYSLQHHREAYDCSKKLVESISINDLPILYSQYMELLLKYYISAFYYKPEIGKIVAQFILDSIISNPFLRNEYNQNIDFYQQQFRFSIPNFQLPNTNPIFVTSLFDIYQNTNKIDFYINHFLKLVQSGIEIICFCDRTYQTKLKAIELPPNLTIIVQELSELPIYKLCITSNALPNTKNLQKDSLSFFGLMNAKVDFLKIVAIQYPQRTIVWIDAGLLKVIKNEKLCLQQLKRIQCIPNKIISPGCWNYQSNVPIHNVCWRFAGGLIIASANIIPNFHFQVEHTLKNIIQTQKCITWEVNIWAIIETYYPELFQWYYADHNDSMILNIPNDFLQNH